MRKALDLFCGAGGVTKGLQRAGFHVTGVDIKPQPRYCGDEFHQADAMTYPLDGFDFIWASPPCQAYMRSGMMAHGYPELVPAVRARLIAAGVPFAIENVPGSPLRVDIQLCGSAFGLAVRRHRWFELGFPLSALVPPCNHSGAITGVYGHPHGKKGAWTGKKKMLASTLPIWKEAMGIDWMTASEISQSIPPAYSEFIGRAAMKALGEP